MNSRLPTETGTVGVLNVGAGDTKLSFDPSNPAERIRAARIVKDMIRRGYALLVEVRKDDAGRPVYLRAEDFDEAVCEYIIADFDPVTAAAADEKEAHEQEEEGQGAVVTPAATRGKATKRRVPAEGAKAVAVARSAGG